jgi:PadR family transcriptional regulator, regulatory protein AphA
MLDNIILGLLLFRSLSIYDIKKAIDQSVSFFYSSSYGNIIPALKKLEKNELVDIRQSVVNGRNRKEYTITNKGLVQFKTWLSQEINIGKIQDEALLRLFFLSEIPSEDRIKLLEDYLSQLMAKITELETIESETRKMEIDEKYREPFNYRIATLEFGIRYYQFELDWYKSVIERIKRKEL